MTPIVAAHASKQRLPRISRMSSFPARISLAVSLSMLSMGSAVAQTQAQSPPTPVAAGADSRVVTPEGTVRNDRIQRIVTQDRNARIDELRVREQTTHIIVTPATGAPYEVIPSDTARDASDTRGSSAGKSVWRLLSF
jgi:hypothetical protein